MMILLEVQERGVVGRIEAISSEERHHFSTNSYFLSLTPLLSHSAISVSTLLLKKAGPSFQHALSLLSPKTFVLISFLTPPLFPFILWPGGTIDWIQFATVVVTPPPLSQPRTYPHCLPTTAGQTTPRSEWVMMVLW